MILTQKPANTGSLSATIRRLYDAVEELRPLDSEDIYVDPTVKGFRMRLKRRPGGGGGTVSGVELEELAVISVDTSGETLTCTKIVPDVLTGLQMPSLSLADRKTVAMPWHLKKIATLGDASYSYPLDAARQERTLTINGASVKEYITPKYNRGDIIIAAKMPAPTRRPQPDAEGDAKVLERYNIYAPDSFWVDLNYDGRKWDAGYTEVRVCINGAWVQKLVKGG